jgi:hypothetical protein
LRHADIDVAEDEREQEYKKTQQLGGSRLHGTPARQCLLLKGRLKSCFLENVLEGGAALSPYHVFTKRVLAASRFIVSASSTGATSGVSRVALSLHQRIIDAD